MRRAQSIHPASILQPSIIDMNSVGSCQPFDARDLRSYEVRYDLHFHIGILAAYISSISAKVRPRVSGMKK